MMFLLQCPGCGQRMKYHTSDTVLTGKVKKCVYCPRSFSVRKNLVKRL